MISLTSPIRTRAHNWPAGAKLLGLCFATMVLFAQSNIVFHLSIFVLVLVVYALPGRVFFRYGVGRLRALWPFIAVVMIWHSLTQDAALGATISLRLLNAVAMANLVTLTTKLSDMIAVVRWISAPLRRFGLPTKQLELGIALAVRFTPVLAFKGTQLSDAWRARSGKHPKWQTLVPLAVLAIDDAEYVADAIKARGGV